MARNNYPTVLQVEKWDAAVILTWEFWYFDKYISIMTYTGMDTAQTASIIAIGRHYQQQESDMCEANRNPVDE